MACDICGRQACVPSFHATREQKCYRSVIDAFDVARALRQQLRDLERARPDDTARIEDLRIELEARFEHACELRMLVSEDLVSGQQ